MDVRRIFQFVTLFLGKLAVGMAAPSTSPAVAPSSGSWCIGKEVNFTCRVEGTQSLVWKSYEYIGTGGDELAYSIIHPPGKIKANGRINGTYTVLISADETGIIESVLHIYMQFNGTVSCIADPPGLMTNVTISIIESSNCQLMETTTNGRDSIAATSADHLPRELATVRKNSASPNCYITVYYIIAGVMAIFVRNIFEGS